MDEVVYIVNEMEAVVNHVNTALAAEGFPRSVTYMYGHPREISIRLQEMSGTKRESSKFPLIILFTDVKIERDTPIGFYGTTNIRMLIANITEPTFISEQRTVKNFIPVLHPIKRELVRQIKLHQQFSTGKMRYTETDMYFYGSQINDKNIFNDYIDATELNITNLIINNKNCSRKNNLK